MRHLDSQDLWIQERVAKGQISIRKVAGEDNLSDILTKHVDRKLLDKHLESIGLERRPGRHELSPSIQGGLKA